ncbi:hypothetical protein SAMN05444365_1051 [Micromonospora pattaloongensis]|uniref:Uncharacterized protein n=2 Tax=Micromonospora pattaloongensis TaxID=405436 RepID=A0A1H3PSZ6_9ACTN|nr:hypothetical protein SAMN05444365_1051 [Micromonospora pattaloongensis]
MREATGGRRISIEWLCNALRRTPLLDALAAVAVTMSAIRNFAKPKATEELDRDSLKFFTEPTRSRLKAALDSGSVIHAPQLLMVLAKLMLHFCPDEVPEEDRIALSLPALLLIMADALDPGTPIEGEDGIPLMSEISLELAANHHFNANFRLDSQMAVFQRRWIEMQAEEPSPFYKESLLEAFRDATGVELLDQVAAAVAIFVSATQNGQPIIDIEGFFSSLGWEAPRAEVALSLMSLPLDEYRVAVAQELAEHTLDWYFTTFARYPLIRLDSRAIVVDPDLLLRRVLSFLPIFDIQAGLSDQRKRMNLIRRAFDDYSERYVLEVFRSLAGSPASGRVFSGEQLKRAYKDSKIADVAVDYGDSWVVLEATTRQVSRDTVNAASLDGLIRDREMVIEEATQIAETIERLRSAEHLLTGFPAVSNRRFYPIVVLTESFPNNPITTALVRDELAARGILQNHDIAPIELMDLAELDMIEGLAEVGGPSLPAILKMKSTSNFWADSFRNFQAADARLDTRRPDRVSKAFGRLFSTVIEQFRPPFRAGQG